MPQEPQVADPCSRIICDDTFDLVVFFLRCQSVGDTLFGWCVSFTSVRALVNLSMACSHLFGQDVLQRETSFASRDPAAQSIGLNASWAALCNTSMQRSLKVPDLNLQTALFVLQLQVDTSHPPFAQLLNTTRQIPTYLCAQDRWGKAKAGRKPCRCVCRPAVKTMPHNVGLFAVKK